MFVFRSTQYLKLTQARNQESNWGRHASALDQTQLSGADVQFCGGFLPQLCWEGGAERRMGCGPLPRRRTLALTGRGKSSCGLRRLVLDLGALREAPMKAGASPEQPAKGPRSSRAARAVSPPLRAGSSQWTGVFRS